MRIETFHTRDIGGKAVRIGVFSDQELTLHVGAELKEIEQLGWEIARSLVIVIPIVLLLTAAGSWWLGSVALTPIENIRACGRAHYGRTTGRENTIARSVR